MSPPAASNLSAARSATYSVPSALPNTRPASCHGPSSARSCIRHQKNDGVQQELGRLYVVDALKRWEPRVVVTELRVSREQHDGENVLAIPPALRPCLDEHASEQRHPIGSRPDRTSIIAWSHRDPRLDKARDASRKVWRVCVWRQRPELTGSATDPGTGHDHATQPSHCGGASQAHLRPSYLSRGPSALIVQGGAQLSKSP
jgi:hypothetical protein